MMSVMATTTHSDSGHMANVPRVSTRESTVPCPMRTWPTTHENCPICESRREISVERYSAWMRSGKDFDVPSFDA